MRLSRDGGLDAHEDPPELAVDHLLHEGRLLGKVDGGLGAVDKGLAMRLVPGVKFGQEPFGLPFIANEVVIHDEDHAPVPGVVDRLQLGTELRRGLGPRPAAKHDNDIAELTLKRTAPRELDRDDRILLDLEEIKAGNGGGGHIGLLVAGVDSLIGPLGQILQEEGPRHLAFIEDLHVAVWLALLGAGGRKGPAEDDELADALTPGSRLKERALLREHRREADHVRPRQILVG